MHSPKHIIEWTCDKCGEITLVSRDPKLANLPPAGWGEEDDIMVIDGEIKNVTIDVCGPCTSMPTIHTYHEALPAPAVESSPRTRQE
jgi:hypothetical protein